MNKGIVISCFAGLGKTTVAKKYSNVSDFRIFDLQTSAFRRDPNIKLDNYEAQKGFVTNITNPAFPQNYLDALEKARAENDVVLITMSPDIRELLEQRDISYTLVLPEKTDSFREKLVARCKVRGNSESFIIELVRYFDNMSRDQKDYKCKLLIIKENQFLEDLLLEQKFITRAI
ncbi:MAG: hypothetical protein FWC00_04305 [Firmicutes bacterium]|nr:hypothetical protein [Bacillota bacterium]